MSSSYLAFQYTKQLSEVLGVSLEETILISHKGHTECYFVDEYKKEFGSHFGDIVIKNPEIILEWTKDLKNKTDAALNCINELMTKDFSKENFELFLGKIYEYGVPHRICKVTVDYIDPSILEKYLHSLTEARVYAEPVYEQMERYYEYMAKKIGEKLSTDSESILGMDRTQFINFLDTGLLIQSEDLKKQYESSFIYVNKGQELIFSGDKAYELEQILTNKSVSNNISGQVAFTGKVRGKVRIILNPSTDSVFDVGDILVTGMTRPEYLTLVEKSAGFITDAGGILSHAAITARELKKPCIIGTKIATKVLKDGDLVEVDANLGTVTIIKKA